MSKLAARQCVPCKGGTPPLRGAGIEPLARQVPEWKVVDEHHLEREFRFKDFRGALEFTKLVGELAEEQGHHPDVLLSWGRARVTLWTHKIGGLSESDFILAAKIDRIAQSA